MFKLFLLFVYFEKSVSFDPPKQCFYCVKDMEEECVRTQASQKWEEEDCGFGVKNT